jgi:acyl-CoA reductase-like NAD-dependent aldehyde dehydrogenase
MNGEPPDVGTQQCLGNGRSGAACADHQRIAARLNQIALKVLPALAAGCTMVLKPSEVTPLSALLYARILEEGGTPKGVFNLVNGDGATAGTALSRHPDVALISFTGSTRAGVSVSRNAAETIKRVTLEFAGNRPTWCSQRSTLKMLSPGA